MSNRLSKSLESLVKDFENTRYTRPLSKHVADPIFKNSKKEIKKFYKYIENNYPTPKQKANLILKIKFSSEGSFLLKDYFKNWSSIYELYVGYDHDTEEFVKKTDIYTSNGLAVYPLFNHNSHGETLMLPVCWYKEDWEISEVFTGFKNFKNQIKWPGTAFDFNAYEVPNPEFVKELELILKNSQAKNMYYPRDIPKIVDPGVVVGGSRGTSQNNGGSFVFSIDKQGDK